MNSITKNIPNCITALRIIGTVCLVFTKPMSLHFFIIYIFTGVTDVLDGFIARKLKITSEFGAKLDSIADLLFYSIMVIMIMPVLWANLRRAIWYAVGVVVLLRLSAYIVAAIKYHRFASLHTTLNKITGGAVFAIPFFMLLPLKVPLCWLACAIAGLGSLEELIRHLKNKAYNSANL